MRVQKFIDQEIQERRAAISPDAMTNTGDTPAFNVCGAVVRTQPQNLESVSEALVALPGVEVHGSNPEGNIVVTIEDTDDTFAAEIVKQVEFLPQVISASLVYHHFEPKDSMEMEEASS